MPQGSQLPSMSTVCGFGGKGTSWALPGDRHSADLSRRFSHPDDFMKTKGKTPSEVTPTRGAPGCTEPGPKPASPASLGLEKAGKVHSESFSAVACSLDWPTRGSGGTWGVPSREAQAPRGKGAAVTPPPRASTGLNLRDGLSAGTFPRSSSPSLPRCLFGLSGAAGRSAKGASWQGLSRGEARACRPAPPPSPHAERKPPRTRAHLHWLSKTHRSCRGCCESLAVCGAAVCWGLLLSTLKHGWGWKS